VENSRNDLVSTARKHPSKPLSCHHSQDVPSQTSNGDSPYGILDECREIGVALDQLDDQLTKLEGVFKQSLARPNMPGYRSLVSRVKQIKLKPESGTPRYAPQVGMVAIRLKATYRRYLMLESKFRNQSQDAAKRQYRIVSPNATDEEVRKAVSNTDTPIFQQAVSI
jgi:syntaxin 1B/2/3